MALKKLHSSDYHVADDSTDIRGWKLHDATGGVIGKVDDLMFDPASQEVRYALVELDGGRKVNVPIGEITLDESDHRATAVGYTRDRLMGMRDYTAFGTDVDDTIERDTYRDYNPDWKGDRLDYTSDRYRGDLPQRIQLTEEQLRVGKRQVETGQVQIGKRAVEEPVSEQIELGQERIEINRTKVDKPVEGRADIGDQTINVTLFGEEPVVDKQTFVKEEIDVNKVRDTHTEKVEGTVRREELVTEGLEQHEFASAEPTEAELRERRRIEKERTDIFPKDDKSRTDWPL